MAPGPGYSPSRNVGIIGTPTEETEDVQVPEALNQHRGSQEYNDHGAGLRKPPDVLGIPDKVSQEVISPQRIP